MIKKISLFVFVFLSGCAWVLTAQNSGNAVSDYPEYYQTVFVNDHVHVYELFAPPGTSTTMHTHAPSVWISLSKARLKVTDDKGNRSITDLNPAETFWVDGIRNSWTLLSGQVHLFIVEVNSAVLGEVPTTQNPGSDDSVCADPVHHHVLYENDHVRVYEGFASTGSQSPIHTHPPSLLISLTKSRFRVKNQDAEWFFDFNPAQVYWIGHFKHAWEVLAGNAHVFAVEVKSAVSSVRCCLEWLENGCEPDWKSGACRSSGHPDYGVCCHNEPSKTLNNDYTTIQPYPNLCRQAPTGCPGQTTDV